MGVEWGGKRKRSTIARPGHLLSPRALRSPAERVADSARRGEGLVWRRYLDALERIGTAK